MEWELDGYEDVCFWLTYRLIKILDQVPRSLRRRSTKAWRPYGPTPRSSGSSIQVSHSPDINHMNWSNLQFLGVKLVLET